MNNLAVGPGNSHKPYKRQGGFKSPPEENLHFWHLFAIKLTQKNLTFPKLIVTNDYQQFLAHFEWFCQALSISLSLSLYLSLNHSISLYI